MTPEQARADERAKVVAFMRERAANIRRYPFESRAKADGMVWAARELQDVADLFERGDHHKEQGE